MHADRLAWTPSPSTIRRSLLAGAVVLGALVAADPAHAQTDYYNTDRGRPVQIEDAYATERYAFEFKLAPVRLERARGGIYSWEVEPEIAYGILPRTHVEVGVPLSYTDAGAERRSGVSGIDVSLLHNFNTETQTLPAFALRADVRAPVGNLAPDGTYGSFTAIGTRTFPALRVHLNAQYTVGSEPSFVASPSSIGSTVPADDADTGELSRWLAGIAVDKTFPLRSFLITGEAYASQPIVSTEDVEYTVGTGIRYQWSTLLAADVGVGRRLNGENRAWYVTFGTAYVFGMASLMPGRAR